MASDVVRDGVFAINKPCGHSSAQVVRECQQAFNPSTFFRPMIEAELARRLKESGKQFNRRKAEKKASQVKIGHGGTLDPLATGVLILGIGSGTKVLSQFLDCTKTYETTVVFGVSTDTYDRVGRVLSRKGYDHVTRSLVEKELEGFRGRQTQIPPLYSALKMNGKPLYEYAREGKPIPREIEGRQVEALEVELVEWYEPGKHNHRWPTEEAEAAERNLAEQVWRVKKQQETGKTLTPEEKEQDDQAIAAHETFKKRFEERQDELIKDAPSRKSRHVKDAKALMSGALGQMPQPVYSSKGSNLVPATPDSSTPPPWNDEGPPACKIRLTVSSGYYVRSFCHDLGSRLGSAAIMAELCRVRQSDFTAGGINTLEYDDLAKGEQVWGPQVADMLARWNGEPEGSWPGRRASPKPDRDNTSPLEKQQQQQQKRRLSVEAESPGGQAKRRRGPSSESGEPARKATRTLSSATKRGRSDDERSWNGIED
ncbi:TruB family pseudouridylate synthase containing protein [Metarhizium album ARSEF 1941]|uniref:tRNA pseudouridine(55) synthase n=1 Tax=Metarhizium album (strain ARSEF 1941) TaxID=1081103 RepID=A0A0B2WS80_METAS|nr:TruB family pseudouridylate synthase containing protein [Metarhizium album ARSEF 1941]KHN95805.1 TruB family pseudouridylate synthase containing protein [Metarhizium album ARSEF 1941]